MAQYAYISSVSETTKVTPFFASYGYEPTAYCEQLDHVENPRAVAKGDYLKDLHKKLSQELEDARERMRRYADKSRMTGPFFERGDRVYLLRKNLRTKRPCDKLDYEKLGPFKIQDKLSDVTYRLELPPGMSRIHPVFHVSLLEAAPKSASVDDDVEAETETLDGEYEPEDILDSREGTGRIEYLVKWEGYGHDENTWEPLPHLEKCQRLLRRFHRRNPDRPKPH